MSSTFNLEEILLHLKKTYEVADKNIRQQSEQKLSELQDENILLFSSKLLDLLKLSIKEIDSNLRLAIILFLKRSIKEKIEKKILNQNSNEQLIQIYITVLVNPNLSNKEIENLKESFMLLLNNTTGDVLIEIINYINKQISSMPLGSVNGIITILTSIIDSSPLGNKKIFTTILEGLISMSYSIADSLYNKYETIELEKNLDDYLKITSVFYNIFYLFFRCTLLTHKKFHIKNENFDDFFEKISILGIKLLVNLKVKDSNRIISWTGDKNKDKTINNMKINIFKYLNYHLNLLDHFIIDKDKLENYNQLTKIIMANLEWVIMNKFSYLIKIESDDNYPDYSYSLVICYMFIFLKRILNNDNFINEYTTYFNSMYKNILLPLLLITDIEEEIALDNECTNGYIIDIEDIITNNKQKKIKSSLAGLIKIFYQKNKNCNEFMIKYTLGLLDYLINNNTINSKEQTLFSENDIIILLLKAYSKDKIICALFLALNIFSDVDDYSNIEENDNLINQFYVLSFGNITNNLNYPPLKHQFIIFIKNYCLRFLLEDNTALKTNVRYLYQFLFDLKYLLISNSAADALQSFFKYDLEENEEVKKILINVAENISLDLEKKIIDIQISSFFDILYDIITNFGQRESDFFKNIFINLCKRVSVEVERHHRLKFIVKKDTNKAKKKATEQTKLNDYKVIINKCFNIIKLLINNKRFVGKNYEIIEESLKPLLEYMDEPKKIDFDEDIVYIIYLIIVQREKITGIGYNLLKNLYKYINKTGGLLLDTYQLINLYLAYGNEQILSNKKWLESLFLAFKSGIKSNDYNKSGLYTSILIQTWIIHCKKIPNDYLISLFDTILNNIIAIMENNKQNEYLNDERYDFLGYVTVLLSGLINYSHIIIPSLKKTSNENNLKKWLGIIVKENEIIFEYEIKIIIYSICIIIKNGIITGDIQYLLNIGIDLLKCQEKNGKYELKKNTRKILNIPFVDEEEDSNKDDDDEEEDEEYIEYKEIKDLVKKTINPVKDLDEFKNFNDLLIYLKQNKCDIYNLWENSLDEQKKRDIINIIAVKRININFDKHSSIEVPRRIVSIKRNTNNINK